jgi:bifunctional ADP-heptose synthase (sugar kinase/adenylyltransferase)
VAVLTDELVERILGRLPSLCVGVLGDLFLDRYLDIDAALTEPSVETGLDAYQVTRVRAYPGAAGTVVNNLVALGVGRVCPLTIVGDDGEGHELRQALARLPGVDAAGVLAWEGRRTPTYTKPMLHEVGRPPQELNRLDIKNRTPTPPEAVQAVLDLAEAVWSRFDAVVVLDQVSEEDCGVVTGGVRDWLAARGTAEPGRFVLADSRERIGLFRNVCVKPNEREAELAFSALADTLEDGNDRDILATALAGFIGRPVFCTRGEAGIRVGTADGAVHVPAYPVTGPVDICGAGDSTSAGIVTAVAAGATFEEAAAFGNLVASITVQQIGVTGTATPEQVRARWREVRPRA